MEDGRPAKQKVTRCVLRQAEVWMKALELVRIAGDDVLGDVIKRNT